jgi:uncharacterized protein
MAFSLYDATIPNFQRILGAVKRLLEKAEDFASTSGLGERNILDARLAPDMLPFAYQVKSTAVHSIGAIEGVRRGQFSPDTTPPPPTFQALRDRMAETLDALDAVTPDELNGFVGKDMCFLLNDQRLDFTSADAFLMSFSLPNFYFHATTTYDLLRLKGMEIGKRDFMGKLPIKR